MIRIGILGAGNIAGKMAATINGMLAQGREDICLYAVAARELARAEAFAAHNQVEKAFGSYEEMLADAALDLVYIATPHSHHYAHIKLCLEAGKHVLCEKAFTVNAAQAKEVLAQAKEKQLLLTEAIWTRYMPSRARIDELLASDIIGKPWMLTANLGYLISGKERIIRPELAGGALLDIGIYPLNFALMHFGEPERVESSVQLTELGMDAQESMTLKYADGRMAVLNASTLGLSDRRGIIYGSKGYMEVENINNPERIRVYDAARALVLDEAVPKQISGYEYEVEACLRALAEGKTECEEMPHAETLRVMQHMDALRKSWGVHYPCE